MPAIPPNPAVPPADLAAPLPGHHAPRIVRGAYDIPVPPGVNPEVPAPADVFESFRGVRAAVFVHCPGGLNHAIRLAHGIRSVF